MTDRGTADTFNKSRRRNSHWRKHFLASLADNSNVRKAADAAGVEPSRAYRARREEPDFAEGWLVALSEGYAHLEMEMLGRLREASQQTDPNAKFDFANAIRVLGAHKNNTTKVQAEKRHVSAAEIRASIDRKIEDIRIQTEREKAKRGELET